MILSSDDLERIAYAPSGDLATMPFPVLLVAYAAMRRTLLLQVTHGPVSKVITFVDGTPVDCQSNLLQDTLARHLLSRGQLSEQQVTELQALAQSSGRPFEQVLAEKRLVEGEALAKSQQQHLARKLLDAFAWEKGSFEVARLASPPETTLKLKVPQLLLMGVEKLSPIEQIQASIAVYAGRPLYLNPQPIFPLGELRLSAPQQGMVEGLRPGKRIEEMDPTGTDTRTERFLYALGLLGVLTAEPTAEPETRTTRAAPPVATTAPLGPSAAAPPAPHTAPPRPIPAPPPIAAAAPSPAQPPAAPAQPPTAPAQPPAAPAQRPAAPPPSAMPPSPPAMAPAIATSTAPAARVAPAAPASTERRREVLELYERTRGLDAFDLLAIPTSATDKDVERALLGFAERTAPWMLGGGDIEAKAREMFLAGVRAFAELSDPERRGALKARRESPINKAQDAVKAAREAFKIQTTLLDPRHQFIKGVGLMQRKRYPEALEQLQYAVDCDPQNAEYRAELARCHWLSQPASRARSSVRELEEATRIDPQCGIAFLHLGEILVSLERVEEAREALKRAAQLLLPDRRGVEALNALPPPGRKGKPTAKLGKWF